MVTQSQKRLATSNLTQKTQEEIIAMEKALHNPLIINKILHSMDLRQLKMCRGVNQKWNLISKQVIKKNDFCQLNFHYTYKPFKATIETLDSLDKILSNSEYFPCSSFDVRIWHWETIPREVKIFFDHHGSKMKTLTLCCHALKDTENDIICQILSSVAPILENLTLVINLTLKWPVNSELPNLKSLNCPSIINMVRILRVAPNLKKIDFDLGITERILNELQECGRLDLIKEGKNYQLVLPKDLNFEGLKLNTLYIYNKNSKKAKMRMEKILESSKDSLRHLTWGSGLCPEIFIPKLPHLKILEIFDPDYTRQDPPGALKWISLDETFPHLQILDLTCVSLSRRQDWANFLPPLVYHGTFPTVKKLKIIC